MIPFLLDWESAHCRVGSRLIVWSEVGSRFCWVGNRLTAWPKVGLCLLGLEVNSLSSRKSAHCLVRGGQVLLGRKLTYCLTQSGPMFCELGVNSLFSLVRSRPILLESKSTQSHVFSLL